MIDKDISKIVANALTKLSPELFKAVGEGKYFVTLVSDKKMVQGENGVIGVELKEYVIIDCEHRITFDPVEFYSHSQYLYNQFKSINKWYEC